MSQSTNGILFYGLCWEDEGEIFPEVTDEERTRLKYPDEDTPDWLEVYHMRMKEDPATHRPYDENQHDVIMGHHCSGDYPMPYVAVRITEVTAYRGSPERIIPLEVHPEWDEQIKAFCEVMKITYSQPSWWLASMWW